MSAGAAGLAGMSRARLRLAMLAFLLALAVPGAVLVFHAYGQLKWEAFHQYRALAEDLSRRIDERFSRLLAAEDAREFADYRFLASEDGGGVVQRSALSRFPVRSEIPGLVGWFQVDPAGALSVCTSSGKIRCETPRFSSAVLQARLASSACRLV